MTIRELPVGGQHSLQGNICHVLVDVSPTVNSLPYCIEDTQIVLVKMKCKKMYKSVVFAENV